MRMVRNTFVAVVWAGLSVTGAAADTQAPAKPKTGAAKIAFSTSSPEARQAAEEVVRLIENLQPGSILQPAAKAAVEKDPGFAFGHYLVGVTVPGAQAKPHLDKAAELMKTASDGERRYFEAAMLNRSQKRAEALEAFLALQKDYPDERMVDMMIGQVYSSQGKTREAQASFERALAKAKTPRALALIGNLYLLNEDYATARKYLHEALALAPATSAPGNIYYGMAFADLYEGKVDAALVTLEGFLKKYKDSGAATGFPEVFIWNSMARINLENGRAEKALELYAKGFESVPGSSIDEQQKTIWRGRLHHGTARTLARLGRHEEAWKHAETLKKMIDEGGEDGKQFVPAYHYLAGYLKLEAGDAAAAIEHLKQADATNEFHTLLLARAYLKAGDKANARKACESIVASRQNSLERALSYPEAKKTLLALPVS